MKIVKTSHLAGAVLMTAGILGSTDAVGAAQVPHQAVPIEVDNSVAEMLRADATETVTLRVKGMTCGGCVLAVRRVLNRMEGVERAEVSLEEQRAVVDFHPEETSVEAIIGAIGDVGFEATPVEDVGGP